MSKIRTPEQKSRKMLKEETTIIDLEMAIKKERFRKTQKRTPEFVHEVPTVDKSLQIALDSVHKTDGKVRNRLNSFLYKIRF
jgi:hypothetical protein